MYTKKDECHYNEMLTGLAQLDDLSTRVRNSGRRIEDLSATLTCEINKTTMIFNTRFEEVKSTLAATSDMVTEFKTSLRQVEANSMMIRDMQLAMETMQSRLTTLEAEKLSTSERFAHQQARMDRIESTVNNQENKPYENNTYVNKMELDDRALNLLAAGLPEELQSVGGIIAYAYEKLNLHMTTTDITNVFKIAETNRGPLAKIRFSSMAARTAFYKARTRLGPNTKIWFNEDLTRANEILAYQARQLVLHKYIFRTWTYLGQVFVQRYENEDPMKVFKKEDLAHHDKLEGITTPPKRQNTFQVNKAGK